MIKFFRNVRKNLLSQGKTTNYLKYAVGEIVLVVIGILIALQINNWNESRKEDKLARQYLQGIENNLKKDVQSIDTLILSYGKDISLINSVDDVFHSWEFYNPDKYHVLFIKPDTSKVKYLFYRGVSFRPVRATYNSLVADGKSGAIKNRKLFESIQEIYDESYQRLASIYETQKPSENRIHWLYPEQKEVWTYSDLKNVKNKKIFLDLLNLTEIKYLYCQFLVDIKSKVIEVISQIDNELNN